MPTPRYTVGIHSDLSREQNIARDKEILLVVCNSNLRDVFTVNYKIDIL